MTRSERAYRLCMRILWSRELRIEHGERAAVLFGKLAGDARQQGWTRLAGLWARSVAGLIATRLGDASAGGGPAADSGRGLFSGVVGDLVIGARHILRRPLAGAVVVLTLALGIGVNAATFSVFRAVQLAQLPIRDPHRLAVLEMDNPVRGVTGWQWSYPNIRDLRESSSEFDGFGVYGGYSANLMGPEGPRRVGGARVSAGFFETLGMPLHLGREFTPQEDQVGGPSLALIGYELWEQQFDAREDVLGSAVTLDGVPYTIIGVLPRGYRFFDRLLSLNPTAVAPSAQVFITLEPEAAPRARGMSGYGVVARLTDQASIASADQEARATLERLARDYADEFCCDWVGRATALQDHIVGNASTALNLAMAAAAAVLALVCVNLGSLVTVQASERGREWAIRRSLGARPARVARQVLLENLTVGALGGVAGLALGSIILRALLRIAPRTLPRLDEVRLDPTTALLTVLASIVAAIAFGLVPALIASRRDPAEALRERQLGLSRRGAGMLRGLVGIEVGLALILTLLSALLANSLGNLAAQDPGYRVDGMVSASLRLPADRYPDDAAARNFSRSLTGLVDSIPGVAGAAISSFNFPIGPWTRMQIQGTEGTDGQPIAVTSPQLGVSPDFFEAFDLRTIAGRTFVRSDDEVAVPVIVVSESLAAKAWPGEDAVGKRVLIGSWRNVWRGGGQTTQLEREVVGVVSDVRELGASAGDPPPYVYMPLAQDPWISLSVTLLAPNDPAAAVDGLRRAVAELDPELPIFDVESLADAVARPSSGERFTTVLVGALAILSVVLAGVGTYGTVSYSVALRRREIGLRKALGATGANVSRGLLRAALLPSILGAAAGLAAFLLVGQSLGSFLYGVDPFDPRVLVPATGVLLALTALATWLPARRAARLDPVAALQES